MISPNDKVQIGKYSKTASKSLEVPPISYQATKLPIGPVSSTNLSNATTVNQLTSFITHQPGSPMDAYTLANAHHLSHVNRSLRVGVLQVHVPSRLIATDWNSCQVYWTENPSNSLKKSRRVSGRMTSVSCTSNFHDVKFGQGGNKTLSMCVRVCFYRCAYPVSPK